MTALPDFFGGSMTSKPPLATVAVCAKTSLLIHSIVSPCFASISAGEKTILSIAIRTVGAWAVTATGSARASPTEAAVSAAWAFFYFRLGGDVLGVLLVA